MNTKTTKQQLPSVVIFGRTNVGKSTLFNCLTEKRKALVSDVAGTTRDSNIGQVSWCGRTFQLIDTGGIINPQLLAVGREKAKVNIDDIDTKVQQQARAYLQRADLILFLVDAKTGLLPQDKQMALLLKKILPAAKNIILVANKVDSDRQRREIAEFNKLSLGEPAPVSAASGSGTGDLLDIIIEKLAEQNAGAPRKLRGSQKGADGLITETPSNASLPKSAPKKTINVCIIGKPNVGKSSLINSLLGHERVIVSAIPHTTREPQDILLEYQDYDINLIDTAGISRKGQKQVKRLRDKNALERLSIEKSLKALAKADIALLMIDISAELTHQEAKIVEEILEKKTGLIIVANKWDLVENRNTKIYTKKIYNHLPFIQWAPIQFLSAATGEKVQKVLDLIITVAQQRQTEISDNALGKLLGKIVKRHLPVKAKGTKYPHISDFKQISSNPPVFSIHIGSKETIHYSYLRFIENRLRKKFGFLGTPITIFVDQKKHVHGSHNN